MDLSWFVDRAWPMSASAVAVGTRADPAVRDALRDCGVMAESAAFGLHHEIRVAAPSDRAWDALSTVTLADLPATRLLSAVRYGRRRPSGRAPLLSSGPLPLVHCVPPQLAIAVGMSRPWQPRPSRSKPDSMGEWTRFDEAGWTKILIAFVIRSDGEAASRLSSDTLVWSTDPEAQARFLPYWRLIEPFAGLIRREILSAVARRAGS